MMKQTLEHSPTPVTLNAAPSTVSDAIKNMYSFSKDADAKPPEFDNAVPCPPFPTMTRCYGWVKILSANLPRSFHFYCDIEQPYDYEDLGFQYAIVYEYVRQTWVQDLEIAQAQMDFFYLTGFLSIQSPKDDNWRQGRLVDFGDLTLPWWRWRGRLFCTTRRDASEFFRLKPGERVPPKSYQDWAPREEGDVGRRSAG